MPKRAAAKSSEGNKKGKSEPVDEGAIFAETMDKVDIKKIMESDGAIVKCILLKKDGTKQELSLNMSPKLGKVQETLGGNISFLGQWEDIGAVAVVAGAATEEESNKNMHKLQPPLHNREAFGDILVIRYDDDGVEADLTLAEYDEFEAKDIAPWEPEDESDEVSDEEDSEEEADVEDAMQIVNIATLQKRLAAAFKEASNRDPTEEELEELLLDLFQRAEAAEGSDEGEEFEEIGEDEESEGEDIETIEEGDEDEEESDDEQK